MMNKMLELLAKIVKIPKKVQIKYKKVCERYQADSLCMNGYIFILFLSPAGTKKHLDQGFPHSVHK